MPRYFENLALAAATLGLLHCSADAPGAAVQIHVPENIDPGAQMAVDDLVDELTLVTGEAVEIASLPVPACIPGEVHIAVLGHRHDERGQTMESDLDAQSYTMSETRCADDGHRVILRGGSLLAGQWAVYDLLQRLGVRYFHPEQTLYPQTLTWPQEPIDVVATPAFQRRSMHVHRTHPVELSPPLYAVSLGIDMAAYQRRWIDWNIKLRQTMVDGWDERFVADYAYQRGLPRWAGFNLLNAQQGGRPILDPDDPRPESEQIAEAIDAAMAPVEGQPDPIRFEFQFNPNEFTVVDEHLTVERLDFVTEYMSEYYPDVELFTINHGTAQEPGEEFAVRFFDLSQFAPAHLGVQVHPLMFYDLQRPAAGVYGNPDFRHMRDWLLAQQEIRRIIYYPEASWWLTFDLPVPLYLAPVTLEARQYDIDLLAPYRSETDTATTGVFGHHLFTSGQEWGYWLIDYCVAQMTWSLQATYDSCLRDFTDQFAEGDEIFTVLTEVVARQVDDMRDPEIVRFLVGSDEQTEAAADIGIIFHPLPPPPNSVLGWDDQTAAALEERSLAPLRVMAADYHGWADRIASILPAQREDQGSWVREIRDGLRVFALRAEHAVAVYETVLDLRAAIQAGDLDQIATSEAGVSLARSITEQAREVVHRREADYRYPPELTTAGDEAGSEGAIANETVYPYRVLSRTHRMFYWERPDEQLAALFGKGLDLVQLSARIVTAGTAVDVTLLADEVTSLEIDWGDGESSSLLEPHVYAVQGFYALALDAVWATGAVQHRDDVAVVERRLVFPKGSLAVEVPAGAQMLEGLLPGFVVGLGTDESEFMALGRIDGDKPVAAQGAVWRRQRSGLTSGPEDFALTLANVGALTLYEVTITVVDGAGPMDRKLRIEGDLDTAELIDVLVNGFGSFDEEGARTLVSDLLGYTPDTLPERVPIRTVAAGIETE